MRKHPERADHRRKPIVDSLEERYLLSVYQEPGVLGPFPSHAPAIDVGQQLIAPPDDEHGNPPPTEAPTPYASPPSHITVITVGPRERDPVDHEAAAVVHPVPTPDQPNVVVSPPPPNVVPVIRDGQGFGTEVEIASRIVVAAAGPVSTGHGGPTPPTEVSSEARPIAVASLTAPATPPISESHGGGISGPDTDVRPKGKGESEGQGVSLDFPGEGPREVPPPHGAGLIAEVLPFDRATLEKAVDRFLNTFEDLGVRGVVETAQAPPPLVLAIVFAALEVARRRLRRSDKTARSGRLGTGFVRNRFPELLGTSSVKRP